MEQTNQQPVPPEFNPQGQGQPSAPQYQPRVVAKPMMQPVEAVTTCLKKYFDFKGRARRSEYWWYMLFTVIVSSVFSFFGGIVPALNYVGMLCGLALFIPQLSALTRRLHDTGRSGWWVVLYGVSALVAYGAFAAILMPVASSLHAEGDNMMLAGIIADAFMDSPVAATVMICSSLCTLFFWIITFVFSIMDSKWGENKYGPSPKY